MKSRDDGGASSLAIRDESDVAGRSSVGGEEEASFQAGRLSPSPGGWR